MSGFLRTKLLHLVFNKNNTNTLQQLELGCFHFHSFTVSYLQNSCGFSLEAAKSLSNSVQFETPDNPDSVLNFLKHHGFTDTHIPRMVRKHPRLLLANAQKTILPKIEFFHSLGVSSTDIVRIFSTNPALLRRSLKRRIIPCYHYLNSILLVKEKVIKTFKRSQWNISDPLMDVAPNIALLKECGVPQSSISLMVSNFPRVVFCKPTVFTEFVREVKQMGFDPLKSKFVLAIIVLSSLSKLTIESRFEIYERWGWSRNDSLSAFKKVPFYMLVSNDKAMKAMDFFVKKMGWPSQTIAKNPNVLFLSIEKTIIPRCTVAHVLLLKGLIEKDYSIVTLLKSNEKYFLKKFVTKYQESVPQLLDLYEGKVDLRDLGVDPIGTI
ncbi:mTERF domain-containing protein [Cephalotus follicularis]|uniref:mTERF domain-containing protein n=1 Tax=Cephalotus follicularis TaxID=3775 RepID=A0A1Q3CN34_CEPFO|nr:mTERF domain-containing protein [Cephalotus follicularis]